MTKNEAKQIGKIAELLNKIRMPHIGSGSKTASMQGMAEFATDMHLIMPELRGFLSSLHILNTLDKGRYDWEPEYKEDSRYYKEENEERFDALISALESTIETREIQDMEGRKKAIASCNKGEELCTQKKMLTK